MTTRLRQALLLAGLAALAAAPAAAQTQLGPLVVQGEAELGGRIGWGDTGAAKFEQYRDLDDGPIGGLHFLLEDPERSLFVRGAMHDPGYDDQRYWLEMGRYGQFKLDLFWGQLPNKLSSDARTIYSRSGNVFTLPAGLQATLEPLGAAAQSAGLGAALAGAVHTTLRTRWNEGRAGAEFQASEHLRLRASYQLQDKQGDYASTMVFGSPGGNFITLPARLDEKIHEIRAGTDYVRDTWSLSFDYIGSIYDNEQDSLVGENPLVATAAVGDASRGQASLAPDNSAHTWSLSGSARLPLDFPNRVTGSFAYGIRFQNDDFLPHTINSAIAALMSPGLVLPSNDLDGEVHTILGNLEATARPLEHLSVSLRGRVYDYDNQTDRMTFPEYVETDTNLEDTERRTVYIDYLKANGELDGAYDFTDGLTGHLGYGFEHWHRNQAREVESLWEHGPVAKLDYRPSPRWLLRADYEFLRRRGSRYQTYNYLYETFPDPVQAADAIPTSQSTELRKYDEANRDRQRFSLLGRFRPGEDAELTLSGGLLRSNYPDSELGLTKSLGWNAGIDAFWQVHERVGVSAFYTYSQEWYDQDSRYRSNVPPMDDLLDNWDSETRNWYHYGGVRANFSLIPNVLDLETAYLISIGHESTTASAVPGGAANGDAVDFPNVKTQLDAVTATLSWTVMEDWTLRTQYRFEDYRLSDFRDPFAPFIPTSNNNSRDIFLGDALHGYVAHVIGFSVIYAF